MTQKQLQEPRIIYASPPAPPGQESFGLLAPPLPEEPPILEPVYVDEGFLKADWGYYYQVAAIYSDGDRALLLDMDWDLVDEYPKTGAPFVVAYSGHRSHSPAPPWDKKVGLVVYSHYKDTYYMIDHGVTSSRFLPYYRAHWESVLKTWLNDHLRKQEQQ